MIEGVARGGPMDGQQLEGRFNSGVVLIDKPNELVWIYDWDGTEFNVREPEGRELDKALQWTAAEGGDYEVRAAPW